MRYCSHCGSELNETDSHCPKCGAPTKNFGGSSAWEEISKTRKLLIGCSILAILLMFVNWGKISYWVFGTVNISPVSIVRNLNESMDLLQSILPQKYSGYCTLFMLYIVALFIGHGASIFLLFKNHFHALLVSRIFNFMTFLFSAAVLYWGGQLQNYTNGIFSLGYAALVALALGASGAIISFSSNV